MQLIISGAFRHRSLKSQNVGMRHAKYALFLIARSCCSLIGAVMFGFTLFCFSLPAAVPLAKMDFMLALVQAFVLIKL